MVHFSSAFTLRLYEAIYLLWRGTFQFPLISLEVQDQVSFSAITKTRDARGERGTPVEPPPPRNRANGQRKEFPLTDWMLEEQTGNLRFPSTQWNIFFFKHVYFQTAFPLAIQPPPTSHFPSRRRWQCVRASQQFYTKNKKLFGGYKNNRGAGIVWVQKFVS